MIKVNCLCCGHNVDLDEGTYADYQGQIKCFACGAILEVKTEEGTLNSVKFVKHVPRPSIEETFERTRGVRA